MHARVKVSEKIEALDVTIALTMPLSEWREVMRQQPNTYPGWKVAELIAESVGQITKATDKLVAPPEQ